MRVREFRIIHKGIKIVDLKFTEDRNSNNFITLVIGQNGVGKSFVMAQLAEVFRAMSNFPKPASEMLKYDEYFVKYSKKDSDYDVVYKKGRFYINDDIVKEFSEDTLPIKVLALSFMLNDKFMFQKSEDEVNIYRYLGLRQVSNAAWITSISKNVSEKIINSIEKPLFLSRFSEVLNYLEYRQKIFVKFDVKRKTLFSKELELSVLKNLHSNVLRKKYVSKLIKETKLSDLQEIINYVNGREIRETIYKRTNSINSIVYEIDITSDNTSLLSKVKYLNIMQGLGLLDSPKVEFLRENQFTIDNASSGEKNIIHTMVNILSEMEDDSLVIIDEPELSLHPNWQIKYVHLLRTIMKSFKNCHGILATHSHFMISDINRDEASIVHLKLVNSLEHQVRISELIEYSTYAWSTENILYTVFGVRTSRNHYFDADVRTLISLLESTEPPIEQIRELNIKLRNYVLDANDPLKILLDESARLVDYAE